MLDLLDTSSQPAVYVATHNLVALGALGTRGIRLSEVLAVIGFDGFGLAAMGRCPPCRA